VDESRKLLMQFIEKNALKRGHFKLASGGTSTYYIDGKMILCDPVGLQLVARAMAEVFRPYQIDAVGGLEIGSIYVATAVSLQTLAWDRPVPQFTVRKKVKEHGAQKLIEGRYPAAGGRVGIVDDVITTGGSIFQAIDAIEEVGCNVVAVTSIVDRESGAAERLKTRGVPYLPLLTISDLGLSNAPSNSDSAPVNAR
jgi:orotate phosphoribosyltransferase